MTMARPYAALRRRVASARSYVDWRFIHRRGDVPSTSARSRAASAVTPRLPLMNSLSRAFVQPSAGSGNQVPHFAPNLTLDQFGFLDEIDLHGHERDVEQGLLDTVGATRLEPLKHVRQVPQLYIA